MMTKSGKVSWKELNPRRHLSADSYFVADMAMITAQCSLLTPLKGIQFNITPTVSFFLFSSRERPSLIII